MSMQCIGPTSIFKTSKMLDDYRVTTFKGSESIKGDTPLKSHIIFVGRLGRPSEQFLRLHVQRYLTVSACGGDVTEDYEDPEIDRFMEELGAYDNKIDTTDPRWTSPPGIEVYAYLIKQKLAE
jgi:hypothetical protein